jgi:hypothetical protein
MRAVKWRYRKLPNSARSESQRCLPAEKGVDVRSRSRVCLDGGRAKHAARQTAVPRQRTSRSYPRSTRVTGSPDQLEPHARLTRTRNPLRPVGRRAETRSARPRRQRSGIELAMQCGAGGLGLTRTPAARGPAARKNRCLHCASSRQEAPASSARSSALPGTLIRPFGRL